MKRFHFIPLALRRANAIAWIAVTCSAWLASQDQSLFRPQKIDQGQGSSLHVEQRGDPEAELQAGTALTSRGQFKEAIPHLLAARGQVANEFAASFNLALCYVGTRQFKEAIEILNGLRADGVHNTAMVNNLLAQAYVGTGQSKEAFAALESAAAKEPNSERLYLFVADACNARRNHELGLKTVELGLRYLPDSPRLHYQRAMFLASLDRVDMAQNDFLSAAKLAPDSEIAFLANAQKSLYGGDISAAVQAAREGVKRGFEGHALLAILGEALIREGISPGEPAFAEAKAALEKAATARPDYVGSQIALGKLSLMENRLDEAIVCLERARQLDPGNRSVYSHLATAYRRRGDARQAKDMLATLSRLNQDEAEKIGSSPGDRKASYGASSVDVNSQPH